MKFQNKIFIVIFLSPFFLCAQLINNQRNYGTQSFEYIRAAQLLDGNYIVGGSTLAGISGTKSCASYGSQDYWVFKMDANNNILWQNCYGGSGNDQLYGITATPEGDVLLYGRSDSPISGNKTVSNFGGYDFWVIKINNDGDVIWQKVFGTSSNEFSNLGITIISENQYLINTSSDSNIDNHKTENSYGYFDYWLLSIDSDGEILWDKTIGGDGYDNSGNGDLFYDVENNRIIISGYSESGISGLKTEQNYGYEDIWLVSLDLNGNLLDQKTLGGNYGDYGKPFYLDANNNLHIIGTSSSEISGNKTSVNQGGDDFWYIKIDINFNVLLDKSYGGLNTDKGVTGLYSSFGDFVFSGFSNSSISGDKTEINRGFGDVWIVGVNPVDGNITWQKTIGGSSSDVPKYVFETPTSYKMFCDSESPISGEKTVPNIEDIDFWIFDVSKTVGISELENISRLVFPNPSSGIFQIELDENEFYTLVDINGKQIEAKYYDGILDCSLLQNGIYFLTIHSDQKFNEVHRIIKAN